MATPVDGVPRTAGMGPRGPVLRSAGAIVTALDWSGRVIAAACLAFMFVALLVNVILRYMFGSGIAWAYEIHALLLPWLVAGGIVIAAARGRNIAITLLPDMLDAKAQRILLVIIHLAILVIALSVLWTGQPILKASKFQTLSTLGIKQVWGYASLVYAFAAMAVIALVDIVRVLGGALSIDTDPGHASLS
ncbi:TRAP transporter small permease [Acuticoccus kandeliae]|uniref:TRAP transporter small permease n=1 Tax=Acuticoccus kandeliae TaxID=2073160 RepID=UPI000D3EC850|nr:TRAP transporter small permease [Acuticoccus kandeliae]